MDNGNFVTRAELTAHIGPMKSDISEIHSDVKALLADRAAAKELKDLSHATDARKFSRISLGVAMFSTLWWVPDAISRFHHP